MKSHLLGSVLSFHIKNFNAIPDTVKCVFIQQKQNLHQRGKGEKEKHGCIFAIKQKELFYSDSGVYICLPTSKGLTKVCDGPLEKLKMQHLVLRSNTWPLCVASTKFPSILLEYFFCQKAKFFDLVIYIYFYTMLQKLKTVFVSVDYLFLTFGLLVFWPSYEFRVHFHRLLFCVIKIIFRL